MSIPSRSRLLALPAVLLLVLAACTPTTGSASLAAEPSEADGTESVTVIEHELFTVELEECKRLGASVRVRCTISYTNHFDDRRDAVLSWKLSREVVEAVDADGNRYEAQRVAFDNGERATRTREIELVLSYGESGESEVDFDVPMDVNGFVFLKANSFEFRNIRF